VARRLDTRANALTCRRWCAGWGQLAEEGTLAMSSRPVARPNLVAAYAAEGAGARYRRRKDKDDRDARTSHRLHHFARWLRGCRGLAGLVGA